MLSGVAVSTLWCQGDRVNIDRLTAKTLVTGLQNYIPGSRQGVLPPKLYPWLQKGSVFSKIISLASERESSLQNYIPGFRKGVLLPELYPWLQKGSVPSKIISPGFRKGVFPPKLYPWLQKGSVPSEIIALPSERECSPSTLKTNL